MPSRNDPPPVYSTKDPSSARTGGFSNQRHNLYPQGGRASRGGRNGPSNQYTFEETTHTAKHTRIVNGPPTPARAPIPTRAPMPERAPLLPRHQQHVSPRQDRRVSLSSVLMLLAGLCGIAYIVFNASGASITFDPPPVPHWNIPTPGKCVKYGTRSYQAYLLDPGTQGLQACHNTSLVWKGVTLAHPDACHVSANGVVGQWNVTFDEVKCSPGWGKFFDKGCGLIESRLWSLPDNEDWMLLCRTTPATINGRYFAQPDYCRNDWSGVHAYWHTDDSLCKGLVGGEHDIPFDEALANESADVEAAADNE